jgi:hypothetical protein
VPLDPDLRGTTSMTSFLGSPLELQNHVYELLLSEEQELEHFRFVSSCGLIWILARSSLFLAFYVISHSLP